MTSLTKKSPHQVTIKKNSNQYRRELNQVVLGKKVILGQDITLTSCTIGDRVHLGHFVKIEPGTIIEDEVYIGHHSTVEKNCRIETHSHIQDHTHITTNVKAHEVWGGSPARLITTEALCEQCLRNANQFRKISGDVSQNQTVEIKKAS